MRALVIQPDPACGPGLIGRALEARGYRLQVEPISAVDSPSLAVPWVAPSPAGADLVLVLGARWSVYDPAVETSWLPGLLTLLRHVHDDTVPVLGICFGAQALARALGGAVEPASRAEAGWSTFYSRLPDMIPEGPWFQWHSDRFSAPPGAELIAHSGHAAQAFLAGRSMGVQFHPEFTPELVEACLSMGGQPAQALDVTPAELHTISRQHMRKAAQRAGVLVDAFLRVSAVTSAQPRIA